MSKAAKVGREGQIATFMGPIPSGIHDIGQISSSWTRELVWRICLQNNPKQITKKRYIQTIQEQEGYKKMVLQTPIVSETTKLVVQLKGVGMSGGGPAHCRLYRAKEEMGTSFKTSETPS